MQAQADLFSGVKAWGWPTYASPIDKSTTLRFPTCFTTAGLTVTRRRISHFAFFASNYSSIQRMRSPRIYGLKSERYLFLERSKRRPGRSSCSRCHVAAVAAVAASDDAASQTSRRGHKHREHSRPPGCQSFVDTLVVLDSHVATVSIADVDVPKKLAPPFKIFHTFRLNSLRTSGDMYEYGRVAESPSPSSGTTMLEL
jgi:hypothetical protein